MKTVSLNKVEFGSRNQSTHDWEKIFNFKSGQANVLAEGDDFDCGLITMASLIRMQAKKRYLVIKLKVDAKEKTVTFHAEPMTLEERAAEDARREEVKTERAAKRAAEKAEAEAAEAPAA